MPIEIESFKAYDIRGQIPNQINTDIACRVGNAAVEILGARAMVVGRDMRPTSQEFADAIAAGAQEGGADVLDIGLCGIEMVYFATGDLKADDGFMVTRWSTFYREPSGTRGTFSARAAVRPDSHFATILGSGRLLRPYQPLPTRGR
jgi:hypothetical protein